MPHVQRPTQSRHVLVVAAQNLLGQGQEALRFQRGMELVPSHHRLQCCPRHMALQVGQVMCHQVQISSRCRFKFNKVLD